MSKKEECKGLSQGEESKTDTSSSLLVPASKGKQQISSQPKPVMGTKKRKLNPVYLGCMYPDCSSKSSDLIACEKCDLKFHSGSCMSS